MTNIVDELVSDIPIYELACLPDVSAAHLSHRTMTCADER
jgi:hypothetical protein